MNPSKSSGREVQRNFVSAALALLLVGLPLWVGGVSSYALYLATCLMGLTVLVQAHYVGKFRERLRIGRLSGVFLAVGVLTLFSVIPFPMGFVGWLSPETGALHESVSELLNQSYSWVPFSLDPAQSAQVACRMLALGMLYLVVVDRVRRRDSEVDSFLEGVALVGLIVVGLGFIQSVLHSGVLFGSYEPSSEWTPRWFVTTFVNENHQAGFLNLTAFTAFGVAARNERTRKQTFYALVGLACLVGVVLSGSRGGWVSAFLGVLLFASLAWKEGRWVRVPRKVAFVLTASAVLSAVVGLAAFSDSSEGAERVESAVTLEGLDSKVDSWSVSFDMVKDFPITGVGPEGFGDVSSRYNTIAPGLDLTHPENVILAQLTDYGFVLGLLILLMFLWALIPLLWRGIRFHSLEGPVIGLVVLGFQNLVDFSLSIPGVVFPAVIVLGVIGGMETIRAPREQGRSITYTGVWALALLVFVVTGVAAGISGVSSDAVVDAQQQARLRSASQDEWKKETPSWLVAQVQRRPADAHLFYLESKALYDSGDAAGARAWSRAAYERAPYGLVPSMWRGRLALEAGEVSAGASQYRELLSRFWWNRSVLFRDLVERVRWLKSQETSSETITAFLDASLPVDDQLFINSLFWLRRLGLKGQAYTQLVMRMEGSPTSFVLRRELAVQLVASEVSEEEVERQVTQLMARHPEAGEGYLLQGYLFERERNFSKAYVMFQEAERRDPTLLRASLGKSRVLVSQGKLEPAKETLSFLRSRVSGDRKLLGEMYRIQSLASEASEDINGAILEMKMATERVPERAAYWLRLGELYESVARSGDALEAYRVLQEQDPTDSDVSSRIKRIQKGLSPSR